MQCCSFARRLAAASRPAAVGSRQRWMELPEWLRRKMFPDKRREVSCWRKTGATKVVGAAIVCARLDTRWRRQRRLDLSDHTSGRSRVRMGRHSGLAEGAVINYLDSAHGVRAANRLIGRHDKALSLVSRAQRLQAHNLSVVFRYHRVAQIGASSKQVSGLQSWQHS